MPFNASTQFRTAGPVKHSILDSETVILTRRARSPLVIEGASKQTPRTCCVRGVCFFNERAVRSSLDQPKIKSRFRDFCDRVAFMLKNSGKKAGAKSPRRILPLVRASPTSDYIDSPCEAVRRLLNIARPSKPAPSNKIELGSGVAVESVSVMFTW